jgi:hypothetical protein
MAGSGIGAKGRGAAGLLALLIVGCSPTLDWREQLVPGTGLVTTFPCRPDRHARVLQLSGAPVRMEMLVCPAGGATYAVGFLDVASPDEVPIALVALRVAFLGNVQAGGAAAGHPPPQALGLAIAGMTPSIEAGQWGVQGRRPDGTPLSARGGFFAHGLRIYQAVVVGSALPADAVDPFFGGLKFPG